MSLSCRSFQPPLGKQLNPHWSCVVPQNVVFEFVELVFENIYFEGHSGSSAGVSCNHLRAQCSSTIELRLKRSLKHLTTVRPTHIG